MGENMNKSKKRHTAIQFAIIGITLLTGLVGGWAGVNWINENNRKMGEYIRSHPDGSAAAVYTFDTRGNLLENDGALAINADKPLVVGSMMKVLVLAAYADAVAGGSLNPAEKIPVTDVERFHLPLTDGQSHQTGLAGLGLQVDTLGFASDKTAMMTLDDAARIMIHYSGNTETDYLISRLGDKQLEKILSITGMAARGPVTPLLGKSLVMFNHEGASRVEEAGRLNDLYLNDPEWRDRQINHMKALAASGTGQPSLEEQAALGEALYMRGTAREYASLLAQVAAGTFISPEVSAIIQQKLESVPDNCPLTAIYYDRLGSKDGLLPGVTAVASYAIPKRGIFSGKNRVAVIILNGMPTDYWMETVQNQTIYLYSAELMSNRSGGM